VQKRFFVGWKQRIASSPTSSTGNGAAKFRKKERRRAAPFTSIASLIERDRKLELRNNAGQGV
jgi:hypothetical protein